MAGVAHSVLESACTHPEITPGKSKGLEAAGTVGLYVKTRRSGAVLERGGLLRLRLTSSLQKSSGCRGVAARASRPTDLSRWPFGIGSRWDISWLSIFPFPIEEEPLYEEPDDSQNGGQSHAEHGVTESGIGKKVHDSCLTRR